MLPAVAQRHWKWMDIRQPINKIAHSVNAGFCFANYFWMLHTQQKLGQRHVYHWVTSPLLLITLCNHLGPEDINCCSFASGMFDHSWCVQDLSCSTVRGRCSLILLFIMRHTFLIGDWLACSPDLSSTHTLCLRSHTVVTVQNEAWHCPAEIDMEFLGKVVVLTAAYTSPKFQHKPLHQWYLHIYADHPC